MDRVEVCSEEEERSLRESGGLSKESRRRYWRGIGWFCKMRIRVGKEGEGRTQHVRRRCSLYFLFVFPSLVSTIILFI